MVKTFPEGMVEEISQFLSSDTEEKGQSLYPKVFETGTFFPLQRKRELSRMMDIAKSISPTVVFEIGADKGGGLYHWCKCLPTVKRVVACEVRGLPYDKLFEEAFPEIDFLWLPKSSYDKETVAEVSKWLAGMEMDALFIDGDKGGFEKDFDAFSPMVRKGGIIFMHDVRETGPQAAWEAVLKKTDLRHEHILDTSEYDESLELEKAGHPPKNSYDQWLRHWKGASASVGVLRV